MWQRRVAAACRCLPRHLWEPSGTVQERLAEIPERGRGHTAQEGGKSLPGTPRCRYLPTIST